ncbi:exonuclease family protein [Mycobacterium xenopi 3993]|nr:exonuclease family protein [Mycobacterium xenopi 3993]
MKVRGARVLGEFATLVDPQRDIPPQIVRLTGITTAMVCDAPTIGAVLPMFFDFARGAVLVATMPASTWRSCVPPPSAYTSLAAAAGAVHVGLARGCSAARKHPACSLPRWRGCSPSPASPRTAPSPTPRHRRGVACAARAGRQPGCAHLRRPARVSARLTPAQRSKRTLAEDLPHRPGSTCFGHLPARSSTLARQSTCAAG